MGLTIHYTAQLRKLTDLPKLVDEVQDICESLDWKYVFVDTEPIEVPAKYMPLEPGEGAMKPITLQGIVVTPPDTESLWLTFTPSGRTSTFIHLATFEGIAEAELAEEELDFIYHIHTKTQGSGVELHIALVKLLKYLEKKYFFPMDVTDEGEYWETMDRAVLEEKFERYTTAINSFTEALNTSDLTEVQNTDDLMEHIEAIFKKLNDALKNRDERESI